MMQMSSAWAESATTHLVKAVSCAMPMLFKARPLLGLTVGFPTCPPLSAPILTSLSCGLNRDLRTGRWVARVWWLGRLQVYDTL